MKISSQNLAPAKDDLVFHDLANLYNGIDIPASHSKFASSSLAKAKVILINKISH